MLAGELAGRTLRAELAGPLSLAGSQPQVGLEAAGERQHLSWGLSEFGGWQMALLLLVLVVRDSS